MLSKRMNGLAAVFFATLFALLLTAFPAAGNAYADGAEFVVAGIENNAIYDQGGTLDINVKYMDGETELADAGFRWVLEQKNSSGTWTKVAGEGNSDDPLLFGTDGYDIELSLTGSDCLGQMRLDFMSYQYDDPVSGKHYDSGGPIFYFTVFPVQPEVKDGVAEVYSGTQFENAMASSSAAVKTVRIMQDITVDKPFISLQNTDKALDINGKKLVTPYVYLFEGRTLTIYDSTLSEDNPYGTGRITASGAHLFYLGCGKADTSLIIDSGKFFTGEDSDDLFFICGDATGNKITINGGYFSATAGDADMFNLTTYEGQGAEFTIGGDAYFESGKDESGAEGAMFSGVDTDACKFSIKEAVFDCNGPWKSVIFADGSLKAFDTANYTVNENYSIKSVDDIDSVNSYFSVKPDPASALQVTTEFELRNALAGGRHLDVTLADDIVLGSSALYVKAGATLNLNGHVLSMDGARMIIEGSLTIDTKGAVSRTSNAVRGSYDFLFDVNEGYLIINGGDYSFYEGSGGYAYGSFGLLCMESEADQAKGGSLTINGGTFTIDDSDYHGWDSVHKSPDCIHLQNKAPASAIINGGTFLVNCDDRGCIALCASGMDRTALTLNGGTFENTVSGNDAIVLYQDCGPYKLGKNRILYSVASDGMKTALTEPGATLNQSGTFSATGKLFVGCEHSYGDYVVDKKASFTAAGSKHKTCLKCGDIVTESIPKATASLSKTAFAYNGKIQTPILKVGGASSAQYSKAWKAGRKNVGTYSVKITLKGDQYAGTKTLTYKINPKGTAIKTPAAITKGFTAKWAKQSAKMGASRITGYQVRYSTVLSMANAKTVTVKGYATTSKKITKLKGHKKYYMQVRTYKTVNGVKYYSAWSAKKSVKTK